MAWIIDHPPQITTFGYVLQYEYILIYADDILIVSHELMRTKTMIQSSHRLKEEPTPPKMYPGKAIREFYVPEDNKQVWNMYSQHYIKDAICCLNPSKENLTPRCN